MMPGCVPNPNTFRTGYKQVSFGLTSFHRARRRRDHFYREDAAVGDLYVRSNVKARMFFCSLSSMYSVPPSGEKASHSVGTYL